MNWKIVAGIALVVIGASVLLYNNTYNKPHLDVSEADVDFKISLSELFDEFESTPDESQMKYSDKVIEINGLYSETIDGQTTIILIKDPNGRIASCELATDGVSDISVGSELKLKGLFIGYDDLMGEVQLKKCSLVK